MPTISRRCFDNGEIEKEASSKTINKTVREFEALLHNIRIRADSPMRARLHKALFKLVRQKARRWYSRGFKRGHETCARKVKSPPKTISRTMRMHGAFLAKKG